MTQELRVTLFGGLRITLDNEDITNKISSKMQAILVYLLLNPGPYARSFIAAMMWSKSTGDKANRSLRVDITRHSFLRGVHLYVDRRDIAFERTSRYWCDVEAFESLLDQADTAEDDAVKIARLREAANLYQGTFLQGFDASDAVTFEEWMLLQTEQLLQRAISALDQLVDLLIHAGNYEDALAYANKLLNLDTWREKSYRHLMWLYAQTGRLTKAITTYEDCLAMLDDEFGVDPQPETMALHEQILQIPASSTTVNPLPPLDMEKRPFQVPPLVPHFMGRDREVARVVQILHPDSATQRVALVGLGGVGKTALCTQIGHQMQELFPDGVLWANVSTSSPSDIAERWALAYGYDFSRLPTWEEQSAALRRLLAEKQALLICDDALNVAKIRDLLPQSGTCKILISTRNNDGARTLRAEIVSVVELQEEDGRSLLTAIITPERALGQELQVQRICDLLHNLPLAITIAGYRLVSRPRRLLADFAERLNHEKNRLDLEKGNREIRASFGISWNALDTYHQETFNLLAVFAGRAFSATAVAYIQEQERYVIEDRLDHLVSLSLLAPEGHLHYRQHPLLADFAKEHLGEAPSAYQRMVDYYLTFARANQQNYTALSPEWENLSASIHNAHDLYLWQTVIDYTDALQKAWFARGRYSEARLAYDLATKSAMALEDETALARSFLYGGQLEIERNNYNQANQLLDQAEDICQETNNSYNWIQIRYYRARIALEQNEFDKAEKWIVEGKEFAKILDHKEMLAKLTAFQARIAAWRGHYEQSRQLGEEALAIQLKNSNHVDSIKTLIILGRTHIALADMSKLQAEKKNHFDQAEEYFLQAIELSEKYEDKVEHAMALLAYSILSWKQKQLQIAEESIQNSLQVLETLGDRQTQAQALLQLSEIYKEQGELTKALKTCSFSLELCRQMGDRLGIAIILRTLGDIYLTLQKTSNAKDSWKQALQIATELNQEVVQNTITRRLLSLSD